MIFPLFVSIFGYAVFSGLWWISQRYLLTVGVPKSVVLFFSGLSVSLLLIFSFIKYGLPNLSFELVSLVIVNIILGIIISYCYLSVLSKNEASLAVSVTAFAPILVIVTGYFILGEKVGIVTSLGIVTILIGTYVMNVSKEKSLYQSLKQIWHNRSSWLWYAIFAAIASSFAIPIEKHLIGLSNFLFPAGMQLFFGWGIFWGIWMMYKKEYKFNIKLPLSRVVAVCIIIGIFFAIANAFQGLAYYYGFAASVGALKRLDGVVTVILASLILKEENIHYRLIGIFIVAIGACLIAFGKVL